MTQSNLTLHDAAPAAFRPKDGQSTSGLGASWSLSFLTPASQKLGDRRIAFRWTVGILILGAALRFAWLIHDRFRVVDSEAFFEARAFATKGELADAYSLGSGLTAHLSPGMPLMVGTVYRWLGAGAPQAEFVLACLSLAFIYVSFLATNGAFKRLGTAPIARIGALAVLALLPLNLYTEMHEFRHWEGAIAAAAIALCLARALELDGEERRPSWLDLGVLAAGGALLSLFSLPAALACFAILGLLALRTRGWTGFVGAAAASAALLVAISYPWALRNEAAVGARVWTRTNFGINFALGYHDKAISPSDEWQVFLDRLREVSPFLHPAALANLKAAGGEVAYDRLLTARTQEWINQHPMGALEIAARHVREFYFPSRWMFWAGPIPVALKQAAIWGIALIGFVGLGDRLARRDWRFAYVAAPLVVLMLPYVLGLPILRYRYPIGGLLAFLAADMTWRASKSVQRRLSSQSLLVDSPETPMDPSFVGRSNASMSCPVQTSNSLLRGSLGAPTNRTACSGPCLVVVWLIGGAILYALGVGFVLLAGIPGG
jgi:hypothetical protein